MTRIQTLVTVAAIALGGCAAFEHKVTLQGYNSRAIPLEKSKQKRVAVVFAEPAMKRNYATSTDGHSWTIENIWQFYEQAIRSAIGDSVATVEFFGAPPEEPFDAYLYPELKLDASGMLSHSCTATYAITLKDRTGRVVKRAEEESKQSFIPIALGETACKSAITNSFEAATYPTLKAIDAM